MGALNGEGFTEGFTEGVTRINDHLAVDLNQIAAVYEQESGYQLVVLYCGVTIKAHRTTMREITDALGDRLLVRRPF
jgi:hypothetical protein